jgi:hypothetical protein
MNRYDPPGQPFYTYAAYRVDSFDARPVDERLSWPLGGGPALTFDRVRPRSALAAPEPNDVDDRNNYATMLVTVAPDNPTDMAAHGASVHGRVGDVVSLKVGVTNQGPAYVSATPEGKGGDPTDPYNAGFRLVLPPTVDVVDVIQPPGYPYQNWYAETTPAGRSYLVLPFSLADGAHYDVEFRVRITSAAASTGTITAQGGVFDPHHADDTAAVWVNHPAH